MGKAVKRTGLSSAVRVRYGGSLSYRRRPIGETIPVNKSARQLAKERRKDRDYVAGEIYQLMDFPFSSNGWTELSFENRDAVLGVDVVMGGPSANEEPWEEIDGLNAAPPGEEGMFLSNAGGEDAVFHEIIHCTVPKKFVIAF